LIFVAQFNILISVYYIGVFSVAKNLDFLAREYKKRIRTIKKTNKG